MQKSEQLLTSKEAAAFLGYNEYTLRRSRVDGVLAGVRAPKHIKLGPKTVRYQQSTLDYWVNLNGVV